MKTALFLGALLLAPMATNAQTVVNNNNIIINNSNGGNGQNGDVETGQAVYWRSEAQRLEAWLYTDRTNYRPGTGVQLRVTLTNLSQNTSIFRLPRKGEYTISVVDTRTNRAVWSRDRSQNRGSSLQLSGNGTAQWVELWDQRDAAGNVVPMGAYRIDVRVLDILPVSASVFLTDKGAARPQPGTGGLVPPDPVTGIGVGNGGGVRATAPVRGVLTLSKTAAQPGDVVRYNYVVTNPNRESVTLSFASSQLFDVWATPVTRTPSATRTAVWRLGDGVMWAQMMQSVTLAGGEQKTFSGTWRVGSDLQPGQTLDVSASLTPSGAAVGTVGAASVRLAVQ